MKTSISILFIVLYQSLFAQVSFEPIFVNQCTNEIEDHVYWYLSDSNNTYGIENYESKPVLIPKMGLYNLHINLDDPILIQITSNKDTIFLNRLDLQHYVSNPPTSDYFECGNLANGEVFDFYANGKLRTRGKFKEGQPIDTLFEYHRNGNLSEMIIPGKKWKSISYYYQGQLKSVFDSKGRFEKEYYRNGQLKKEVFWNRKHVTKSIEYDENGYVLKTSDSRQ